MDTKYNSYQKPDGFWLPLDNAAEIYPAVISGEHTAVFRISAFLKERIKIKSLIKEVHSLEDRFPYYKVLLKKGFFWYYFGYADHKIPVKAENQPEQADGYNVYSAHIEPVHHDKLQ